MRLEQHVRQMLLGPCGVSSGAGLVIAVSGGPDSMALLHLLAAAQKSFQLRLIVVWIDHGLRPLETPQEKKIVMAAAAKLGIPAFCRQVDVLAVAKKKRLSIEHAARELRYTILRDIARECKAEWIAVGHTADDQAEEVLLRLLRGSGRKGLSGMNMQSKDIIRPLLRTSKQELVDWLQKKDIAFCLDSSNQSRKFLRNRVRNELLPYLCTQFAAGIKNALLKTAESLAADEALLEDLTAHAFQETVQEERNSLCPTIRLLRQPFLTLAPALQRRVVEQILWQLGNQARYEHIVLLVETTATGRNNSELHLSQGLRVAVQATYLEFSYPVGRQAWRGRLNPKPTEAGRSLTDHQTPD